MVMNIGYRPTCADGAGLTVEIHVLHGYREDFYGEPMRAVALGYIRQGAAACWGQPTGFFLVSSPTKRTVLRALSAVSLLTPSILFSVSGPRCGSTAWMPWLRGSGPTSGLPRPCSTPQASPPSQRTPFSSSEEDVEFLRPGAFPASQTRQRKPATCRACFCWLPLLPPLLAVAYNCKALNLTGKRCQAPSLCDDSRRLPRDSR